MEVMNVPQARSRISLAPSMVNTKRKSKGMKLAVMPNNLPTMSGEGIGTDIFKAVAPAVIDLASNYAKNKLGGMAMPIKMSPAQKRTLKKGGAITIKPEMISDVANEALALLPANAKKILGALNNNKSIRYSLRQGEDLVNRMTGKGIMDLAMPVMRAVAPALIDLASNAIKKKVSGEGVMDVLKDIGKAVAPVAIDLASNYAKKKVSGGAMGIRSKKKSVMSSNGSPYVPFVHKGSLDIGNGIYPAGAGVYPAGKSGCGMHGMGMHGMGMDMPIQLGSPYINSNSPAMTPFIADRSIQSNNPIKQGNGVIGSTIGQVLGNMLPF
jgi:hypothetical protein